MDAVRRSALTCSLRPRREGSQHTCPTPAPSLPRPPTAPTPARRQAVPPPLPQPRPALSPARQPTPAAATSSTSSSALLAAGCSWPCPPDLHQAAHLFRIKLRTARRQLAALHLQLGPVLDQGGRLRLKRILFLLRVLGKRFICNISKALQSLSAPSSSRCASIDHDIKCSPALQVQSRTPQAAPPPPRPPAACRAAACASTAHTATSDLPQPRHRSTSSATCHSRAGRHPHPPTLIACRAPSSAACSIAVALLALPSRSSSSSACWSAATARASYSTTLRAACMCV